MENGPYRALGIIEAIRTRPEMYIGNTETPDGLLVEIVDNMLDELANGFANNCGVNIQDEFCQVFDNGRGLEVYQMELSDGRKEDSIIALCTEAHTGSKFDNEDYQKLIGLHGVGLVAVNALSNWLRILTRDRKNRSIVHDYYFKNSELSGYNTFTDENGSWSTVVQFSPNENYFEKIEFDTRHFANRLLLAQAKFNEAQIWFNDKAIPRMSFNEYIRNSLGLSNDVKLYQLYHEANENKKIEVYITYTDDSETIVESDVNLRNCSGTFQSNFQTLLKKCIYDKIDKKLKDTPQNLLTLGLKLYISLSVPEPKFSSQEKSHMTLNVKDSLITPLQEQINWFLKQNGILETIEKNIEQRLKKTITTKKKKRKSINPENKLRDSTKTPGKNLYIVEGDSALGPLKQIRDVNTEGIYPIRGKIINVETNSIEKIKQNKEVNDLLEALGPEGNRRYENIKVLADADADGRHIAVLLTIIIQKFAKEYIQNGKFSIILTPLYGAMRKDDYIPIYNYEDSEYYQNQGYSVTRFKGLGEMSAEQLKQTIDQGIEYILEYPEEKTINTLINTITDTNIKKMILNDSRCVADKVLEKVIQKN